MQTIQTSTLSESQTHEIELLTKSCRSHDNIRLTYPAEESGGGCIHYLLYEDGGVLAAILAMLPLDAGRVECCAFTLPTHRRRGYFSCLLKAAMKEFEEYEILFAVQESCPDTMETLAALGAELESREHQMALLLPQCQFAGGSSTCLVRQPGLTLLGQRVTACSSGSATACSSDRATACSSGSAICEIEWTLAKDSLPIGRCFTTPVSGVCVCLHRLEIAESLRRHGYGSDFMSLLLPQLSSMGIRKVILQVSGHNTAAAALYKKTGFRLTETLSYYCY